MAQRMTKARAGALAAALVLGGSAAAQTSVPSGPPPAWRSLIPCAEKSDPVEGFKCYQAAMRAAGFSPDAQAVAAEKRRTFGLQLPTFHARKHQATATVDASKTAPPARSGAQPAQPSPAPPQKEAGDEVTVTLDQVAVTPPLNRLLLVTTEGAVWVQTDNETVAPLPRPGQTMTVVHGAIDGYFCKFDRRTKVRCVRRH